MQHIEWYFGRVCGQYLAPTINVKSMIFTFHTHTHKTDYIKSTLALYQDINIAWQNGMERSVSVCEMFERNAFFSITPCLPFIQQYFDFVREKISFFFPLSPFWWMSMMEREFIIEQRIVHSIYSVAERKHCVNENFQEFDGKGPFFGLTTSQLNQ